MIKITMRLRNVARKSGNRANQMIKATEVSKQVDVQRARLN